MSKLITISQVRQLFGLVYIPTCRSSSQASLSHVALQNVRYKNLGANPWAKVHQRGDDLLPTKVYHPAKLHRPPSTHAGDICYKFADKETNKQSYKRTKSK